MRYRLAVVLTVALVLLPLPAGAQQGDGAEITLVHGLRDFLADVYLDGQLVLEGFTPERVTDAIPVAAGSHRVAIRAARADPSSEPALSGQLDLGSGETVTVVAHLDGEGEPALSWFTNDLSPVPPGEGRLVLRNVAESGPVSLVANERPLAQGVPTGDEGGGLLQAEPQQLLVQGPDAATLAQASNLDVGAGTFTAVYLIGSQSDDSLGLLTQRLQGGQSPPGRIDSGTGGRAADARVPPALPVPLVPLGLVAVALAGVVWSLRALRRAPRPE